MKIKALKLKDILKKMKDAKTYEEYCQLDRQRRDYIDWLIKSEEKLQKVVDNCMRSKDGARILVKIKDI